MSSLQIPRWTAKEVADWLRGLDECLQQYVASFLNNSYTGERLLKITAQDLDDLRISKLGHQEILLEAIELLKGINYDQPEENLQTVLLRLNTKSTNLKNELEKIIPATRDASSMLHTTASLTIPANILLRVADTVTATKTLISWLDRPPFSKSEDDFKIVRREVLQLALEITQAVQKQTDLHAAINTILASSQELMLVTDSMIKQSTDPLVISPTIIDEVTIKKKHSEEDLGLFLKTSSIDGVHVITGTKEESAAGVVGKVHSGDEVLQVNAQTVVGWDHKKVIEIVKEDPLRVSLTLRKRPKNLSPPGQIQRAPQNNLPIYRGLRPTAPAQKPQTRSRKNSDPTNMLRVVLKGDIDTGGPGGAHSDNDSSEQLSASFDENRGVILRRETIGAGLKHSNKRGSRHSSGSRPRSLPEDIDTEAITADWLKPPTHTEISPISGSPPSSDSQQTPSPVVDKAITSVPPKKKSVRIMETNTNNNTETSTSSNVDISVMDDDQVRKESVTSESSVISHASSLPKYKEEKPRFKTVIYDGEEVQVRRRKKKRVYNVNKHVSCVDLGPGECQGWLKLKTKKKIGSQWPEVWFVLKEYVLYYYKNKQDMKAKGVICLPGYTIQEAPDSSKKYVFKAVHRGTDDIYFRAESESDKRKWFDKLCLATTLYDSQDQGSRLRKSRIFKDGLVSTANKEDNDVTKPMPKMNPYHSESEDDDDDKSKTLSIAPSIDSTDGNSSDISISMSPVKGNMSPVKGDLMSPVKEDSNLAIGDVSPDASSVSQDMGSPTKSDDSSPSSFKTPPTSPSSVQGQTSPYDPLQQPPTSAVRASMYQSGNHPNHGAISSPPPFMRRLKGGGGGNSSPSTPNNTPAGSPTILKRMMTAIRRRSESMLTFNPDHFTQQGTTAAMPRSVSNPEFDEKEDDTSSETSGEFKRHYVSIKAAKVGVAGFERSKNSRIMKRLSQKEPEYFRNQLHVVRNRVNEKELEKNALERTLTDRKNELTRLEALFVDPLSHETIDAWKKSNEEFLEHTIDRLNSSDKSQNQRDDDDSSDGTCGDPEGVEDISGMAKSSLVIGRPRAESECSETSI